MITDAQSHKEKLLKQSGLKVGSTASVWRRMKVRQGSFSVTAPVVWDDQVLPSDMLLRVKQVYVNITPVNTALSKARQRQIIDHVVAHGMATIAVEGQEVWCSGIPSPQTGPVRLQYTFDILPNDKVDLHVAWGLDKTFPEELCATVRAEGVLYPHLQQVHLALDSAELRLLRRGLAQLSLVIRDARIKVLQNKLREAPAASGAKAGLTLEGADERGRQLAHDLYQIATASGPDHLDHLIDILQQLKEQTP